MILGGRQLATAVTVHLLRCSRGSKLCDPQTDSSAASVNFWRFFRVPAHGPRVLAFDPMVDKLQLARESAANLAILWKPSDPKRRFVLVLACAVRFGWGVQ